MKLDQKEVYNRNIPSHYITVTHIINMSFENSQVPDKLKIAKVIPIHKKNEKIIPDLSTF